MKFANVYFLVLILLSAKDVFSKTETKFLESKDWVLTDDLKLDNWSWPNYHFSYGPFGGNGGKAFDDLSQFAKAQTAAKPLRLKKISWRAGAYVDQLTFHYRGRNQLSITHGGNGGTPGEWSLSRGEVITDVYVRSGVYVDSLQFKTNKGNFSPKIGGNGGDYHQVHLLGGLIGFTGRSGSWMDSITFHSNSGISTDVKGKCFKVFGPYGGNGGSNYGSLDGIKNFYLQNDMPKINSIFYGVTSHPFLSKLQFNYRNGKSISGGSVQRGTGTWSVPAGEKISRIVIRSGVYVDGIQFTTNRDHSSPWVGGHGGTQKVLDVTDIGGSFVGFYGRSGSWMDKLYFVAAHRCAN